MSLSRVGAAIALAACVAGCATQSSVAPSAVATAVKPKAVAADRIRDAVAIDKSTRADVVAALGETLAISFDTGYEIWVYRLVEAAPPRVARLGSSNGPGANGEFVILFSPSGVVAKTRIRPAPQGG